MKVFQVKSLCKHFQIKYRIILKPNGHEKAQLVNDKDGHIADSFSGRPSTLLLDLDVTLPQSLSICLGEFCAHACA